MSTTVAISLPQEELAELDDLRRGVSRADVIRDALRWYVHWAERLPFDDPIADEVEP